MNNPYFKRRKIRHADLLVKAGFEIDMAWYKDSNKPQIETGCTKLIYWKRGDIRVTLFDYENISLTKLIDRIQYSIEYNLKEKARVEFI